MEFRHNAKENKKNSLIPIKVINRQWPNKNR